jgi:ABC-type Zn uptake system ZnuABC Zn-binding protein ZnuA
VQVARLIKTRRVKVVVADAADEKVAANLARETGAKLVLLWPVTNPSGDYIKTLQENIRRLVNAFHE